MPNPNTAAQKGLDTPNKQNHYEVTRADLPVHCPMPGTSLWNSHSRVFIPVEDHGTASCPYCGAEYVLKD
jgi:uncharacterized Zn-finger protein